MWPRAQKSASENEGALSEIQFTPKVAYRGALYFYLSVNANQEALGLVWVAQLVRVLSQYTKVMGLIPSQGTYKNQPMNA